MTTIGSSTASLTWSLHVLGLSAPPPTLDATVNEGQSSIRFGSGSWNLSELHCRLGTRPWMLPRDAGCFLPESIRFPCVRPLSYRYRPTVPSFFFLSKRRTNRSSDDGTGRVFGSCGFPGRPCHGPGSAPDTGGRSSTAETTNTLLAWRLRHASNSTHECYCTK